ncbi:VENN motif pre-toxin domain-containing protein [Acinetobacter gyllenbergii]|uniref:VENN motif pre-toxin domain-containing protein n=1 Tax=Acinetobacter gyllenbergii TaxID=134534 RepID=UPI001BB462AA
MSAPIASGAGIAASTLSPAASYEIGQYFKGKDAESSAAHILAHTILGAAVAATGGNNALSAGIAAGGAEAAAPLLAEYLYGKKAKDLTASEKSTISSIVGLAGSAVGATTGDVSSTVQGGQSAQNAVENNKTSVKQDIKHALTCWGAECRQRYKDLDVAQQAAYQKGKDQAVTKFVNDLKNLPNVPKELYDALKNDPQGTAKAIYEGVKQIPGDLIDTGKTIATVNTVGDTPAEFEKLGNVEMTVSLNALTAAISAGTVTVAKKGGGIVIEAAKDINRVLKNDPAKLPSVKVSSSGNISAKQISENGKIIDPPKEVLSKQQELLNNSNHNQTGALREQISDSYFKSGGYTKLESKCGSNCFDGVYTKNGEIYIVEVKPLKERGSVKLSSANPSTGLDVQMSDAWIKSRANELSNQKNNSAAKATGDKLLQAIENGKPINKIVVGVNEGRAVTLNLGNNVK